MSADNSNNAGIIAQMLTNRIFRRVTDRRSLSNSSMIDASIASVDWNNVEDAMEHKISEINKLIINQFVESVIKETMKRIMTVVSGDDKSVATANSDRSNFFGKLLSHSSGNRSIDDFSQALTKIITNLMPPNDGATLAVSSDLSIDERDVAKPPDKYAECPPLGAPVIMDGTLVAIYYLNKLSVLIFTQLISNIVVNIENFQGSNFGKISWFVRFRESLS